MSIDQEAPVEKQVEEVLYSDIDPVSKVQNLIEMGFDQTDADEIVEHYQAGQREPVYYERLYFEDEE